MTSMKAGEARGTVILRLPSILQALPLGMHGETIGHGGRQTMLVHLASHGVALNSPNFLAASRRPLEQNPILHLHTRVLGRENRRVDGVRPPTNGQANRNHLRPREPGDRRPGAVT
jgi:hypothetical protein